LLPLFLAFFAVVGYSWTVAASTAETDVRAAAQRIFNQLQSGEFAQLYDGLPSASRQRVSRERFVSMLERTRDLYKLDRIEIGAVRVQGDMAVADTVMYAHIYKPIESDGKIVAQQYMVKENGTWRVATGDRGIVEAFLRRNPDFGKRFPVKSPRIYIKREGQWVDVSTLRNNRG
jgi:hypothetical protein